jgi:hypothetical protein
MMVGVFPHIVQVVVLTTCSNALLGIASTREFAQGSVRISSAQKNWLVLVHPSVSKEKSRVIEGDDGARLPINMVLIFEELDEGISDALGRPLNILLCVRSRHGGGDGGEMRSEEEGNAAGE